MSKLEGKIAVVTGASRGIGRAIARRVSRDGVLVAVHYGKRRDAADETVREIECEPRGGFRRRSGSWIVKRLAST